jgi:hypothetical protein
MIECRHGRLERKSLRWQEPSNVDVESWYRQPMNGDRSLGGAAHRRLRVEVGCCLVV